MGLIELPAMVNIELEKCLVVSDERGFQLVHVGLNPFLEIQRLVQIRLQFLVVTCEGNALLSRHLRKLNLFWLLEHISQIFVAPRGNRQVVECPKVALFVCASPRTVFPRIDTLVESL